jgi:hypothetical protein
MTSEALFGLSILMQCNVVWCIVCINAPLIINRNFTMSSQSGVIILQRLTRIRTPKCNGP